MTLGDRYTENVENIYKVTIKLIIETLEKGYNTWDDIAIQNGPLPHYNIDLWKKRNH